MNVAEVVAIMGGHTLGRAFLGNSGFDGGWVTASSSFSNLYYKSMSGVHWNNGNSSNVWLGPVNQKTMLLKPDVELLLQTFPSPTTATTKYCDQFGGGGIKVFNATTAPKNCPIQSRTNAAFASYVNNIQTWYGNFTTAYQKMTEYLNPNLKKPVLASFAPSLAPTKSNAPSKVPVIKPTFVPSTRAPSKIPVTKAPIRPVKPPV